MDKLFEVEEGLFQVVRPCTDNGVWKYDNRKLVRELEEMSSSERPNK